MGDKGYFITWILREFTKILSEVTEYPMITNLPTTGTIDVVYILGGRVTVTVLLVTT